MKKKLVCLFFVIVLLGGACEGPIAEVDIAEVVMHGKYTGPVDLVFSPNGRFLAALFRSFGATKSLVLRLWDTQTGELLGEQRLPYEIMQMLGTFGIGNHHSMRHSLYHVSVSSTGSYSPDCDRLGVAVWDSETGTPYLTTEGSMYKACPRVTLPGAVDSSDISSQWESHVLHQEDKRASGIWYFPNHDWVVSLHERQIKTGSGSSSSNQSMVLRFWGSSTGAVFREQEINQSDNKEPLALSLRKETLIFRGFSFNGTFFYVNYRYPIYTNGKKRFEISSLLFDSSTGRKIQEFKGFRKILFSADGQTLYAGGWRWRIDRDSQGKVRLKKERQVLGLQYRALYNPGMISRDGRYFLHQSKHGNIFILDVAEEAPFPSSSIHVSLVKRNEASLQRNGKSAPRYRVWSSTHSTAVDIHYQGGMLAFADKIAINSASKYPAYVVKWVSLDEIRRTQQARVVIAARRIVEEIQQGGSAFSEIGQYLSLSIIPSSKAALPILLDALDNNDFRVTANIILHIIFLKRNSTLNAQDFDPFVDWAVMVLKKVRYRNDITSAMGLFIRDQVNSHKESRYLPLFTSLLTDKGNPAARTRGAKLLSLLGEESLPVLKTFERDSDVKVNKAVSWAIQRIEHPKATPDISWNL